MKILYRCEVCGRDFATSEEALTCENQDDTKCLRPVGCIYGYKSDYRDKSLNLVFVVNSCRRDTGWYSHSFRGSSWAFRGCDIGDTIGNEYCEADMCSPNVEDYENNMHIWWNKEMRPDWPEYKRAIAYLASKHPTITPTVSFGDKIISVQEFETMDFTETDKLLKKGR